jgi:hypothetical protein
MLELLNPVYVDACRSVLQHPPIAGHDPARLVQSYFEIARDLLGELDRISELTASQAARTVSTPEELRALPAGTVLLDSGQNPSAWQIRGVHATYARCVDLALEYWLSGDEDMEAMFRHGPFTVWSPAAAPSAAPTATWTDPATGTEYDLTMVHRDTCDSYWHHVGWLTIEQPPIPLVMWSGTADPADLAKRWADVTTLDNALATYGPLTQAPPAAQAVDHA